MTPEELKAKKAEVDKRIAANLKLDDADRERARIASNQQYERCRVATETIYRQEAWLKSVSPAARQSAANEIRIQQQRIHDYGC